MKTRILRSMIIRRFVQTAAFGAASGFFWIAVTASCASAVLLGCLGLLAGRLLAPPRLDPTDVGPRGN